MPKKTLALLLATVAGALTAGSAAAQAPADRGLEVTPWVGLFKDTYDIGADGNTGVLGGLRLGYGLSDRVRLVGNLGYGEAGDVAGTPAGATDYLVYENRWIMTTAGAEYDLVQGPTAFALGLQVGAGWRQMGVTGEIGDAGADAYRGDDGWAFYDVVVPGITLRRQVGARTTLELGLSDYVFDLLEASPDQSPALSLGVTIR